LDLLLELVRVEVDGSGRPAHDELLHVHGDDPRLAAFCVLLDVVERKVGVRRTVRRADNQIEHPLLLS
jgi:hypothetical protein